MSDRKKPPKYPRDRSEDVLTARTPLWWQLRDVPNPPIAVGERDIGCQGARNILDTPGELSRPSTGKLDSAYNKSSSHIDLHALVRSFPGTMQRPHLDSNSMDPATLFP